MMKLFNWGKKGSCPYGFRATCPTLFDFSSRFFGKGYHFLCLLGPWLCHQKPSTVPPHAFYFHHQEEVPMFHFPQAP